MHPRPLARDGDSSHENEPFLKASDKPKSLHAGAGISNGQSPTSNKTANTTQTVVSTPSLGIATGHGAEHVTLELNTGTPSHNKELRLKHSSSASSVEPDGSRIEAASLAGVTMIVVGTLMYGIFGIINRLSMLGQKSTPYQSAAAMAVAELGKFVISILLLINENGLQRAWLFVKNQTLNDWITFAIPAALYSFTNNLDFYILQYMDPGSMQVLAQTKIITTCVLWWYCFGKRVVRQEAIAMFILSVGSMLVVFKDDYFERADTMYVEWPWGPFYVLIQVTLSAVAGIYTEAVYKRQGRQRSIHLENLGMFFWGTLANFMQYAFNDENNNGSTSKWDILYGFNYWTWLLIAVYVVKDLAIAQIMKYFTNVVKLFMASGSIVVTGILTYVVFGLNWTLAYFGGLACVVTSVVLHKMDKKIC